MKGLLRNVASSLSHSLERFPGLHRRLREQFLKLPAGIRGEQIVFDHLSRLARDRKDVFFLQVGANDGVSNDPVHTFVHKHGWRGIVVEPVPAYFAELKKNYEGCAIIFEQVAVSEQKETREFYYLENPDGGLASWAKGVGSFYKENLTALRDDIPDFDERFTSQEVECVPLGEVLERNAVERVDLFVIDAEGYDGKILMQFDFDRLKPEVVIFEHKLLDAGEMESCVEKLRRYGYAVEKDAYDAVATRSGEGESMSAQKAIKRLRVEAADRLRYFRGSQAVVAAARLVSGLARRFTDSGKDALAMAYRELLALGWPDLAERFLTGTAERCEGRPGNIWFERRIGQERYGSLVGDDGVIRINRSLVLKSPVSAEEKGVLVVWFEPNLVNLLRAKELEQLLNEYILVFASAWSPPQPPAYWPLINLKGAECVLTISNEQDVAWMERVGDFDVIPLYMSSWEDPEFFETKPIAERKYDLLMVANWAPFKRHWRLFKALAEMPSGLRIALVGQPQGGRTLEDIKELAALFEVKQEIDYFNRLPIEKVAALQCDSVAALILSMREGSCVAVAESMIADSPVAMLEDAHVGSRAFINAETGVLLSDRTLARDLKGFLHRARAGEFQPRRWACRNISWRRSMETLEEALAARAGRRGDPWTAGITEMCCRGVPAYVDPGDYEKHAKDYEKLLERHGVEIEISGRPGADRE